MSTQPGSPVERDGGDLPASVTVSGLTPGSERDRTPEAAESESGPVWRTGRSWGRTIVRQVSDTPDKGTDELIGVMNTPDLARQVVDAVNGLRVVDDEETVERAAEVRALTKALEASRAHARGARQQGLDRETCRFWQGVSGFLRSRIRALEAGEEPDWPDAANSVRADLGSCVRCGVRDAKDDGQLCGECDAVLEAEFGSQALRDGRSA